jgi:hypothetical protein
MMQNGFRRLALAQGLLPERLASHQPPAPPAPAPTDHPDATDAADSPTYPADPPL